MSETNGTTAWALAVVSDPQQTETLKYQEAWARETASLHNWTLSNLVVDVSSGRDGTRKVVTEMLDKLASLPRQQRPARLLMIRLDRLGRGDGTDAFSAYLKLRELEVIAHTREDGDVRIGRASDLLVPMMRSLLAGFENETRREKLCAMYQRRRAARAADRTVAICMRPPYGLTYEKGHVVAKPDEAAAVRLAYELKGQGYGYRRIAKRLGVEAAPMTLRSGEVRHQRWTADRVRRLIKKDTYRGTIIDDGTWLRAQRHAREVRRPTRRLEYPLGGALTCFCGYALIGSSAHRVRAPRFRYYHCRNLPGHGGRSRHYSSTSLEGQFVDLLGRLSAEPSLLEAYAVAKQASVSVDALEAQLASLKRELRGLDDRRRAVHIAHEDGALRHADLQWRLNDLEQRRVELNTQIDQVQYEIELTQAARVHHEDLHGLLQAAQHHWTIAQIDDRRALAKAIGNALGGFTVSAEGKLSVGNAGQGPACS